jgi:hypothetical protein
MAFTLNNPDWMVDVTTPAPVRRYRLRFEPFDGKLVGLHRVHTAQR